MRSNYAYISRSHFRKWLQPRSNPKKNNKQARQSQEIVRTVLANKSMDEQCALMDAMKDRKMFRRSPSCIYHLIFI